MTFALPIQVLLAQITVPALEQNRKQTQFIFFAELGHGGSEDGLSKRANTQLASNARQLSFRAATKERRCLHRRLSFCSNAASEKRRRRFQTAAPCKRQLIATLVESERAD
jgi:hypothetical protein